MSQRPGRRTVPRQHLYLLNFSRHGCAGTVPARGALPCKDYISSEFYVLTIWANRVFRATGTKGQINRAEEHGMCGKYERLGIFAKRCRQRVKRSGDLLARARRLRLPIEVDFESLLRRL